MTKSSVEIDELWFAEMSAKAALSVFVGEFLLINLISREEIFANREALIENLRREIKAINAPQCGSEREAVIASDIGVWLQDYADNFADILRSRLLPGPAEPFKQLTWGKP